MKLLPVLFGIVIVLIVGSSTFGQTDVKQAPLTWQQAALTDGEDLYFELCAVCHGKNGSGNGPAASAMSQAVPDLTALAANNEGEFPRQQVKDSIEGKSRVVSHGTSEMPIWGQMFVDVRPDWKQFRREGLARQRIYNLTEYLATIQAE